MIAEVIEQKVRAAWAKVESENPDAAALIYALIPVSPEFTLGDIPNIPECIRIEVLHTSIGSNPAIGLKFIKEAGR